MSAYANHCSSYEHMLRGFNVSLVDCDLHPTFASEQPSPGENLISNLEGRLLNISVLDRPDAKFDSDVVISASGKVTLRPCISRSLLDTLLIAMNFTPSLKPSDHWGYYNANKSTWNGMIGALLSDEADFAVSSTFDMPLRRRAVDFTFHTNTWTFIALHKIPSLSNDALACMRPFQTNLWFAIVFSAAVLTAGLVVMRRKVLERLSRGAEEPFADDAEVSSLSPRIALMDCIFWPINLLCSKGADIIPPWTCFRFALFVCSLAGGLLNAAYSGDLISFLTVGSGGFKSLEQILSETDYEFDTKPLVLFDMLKASTSPSVIKAVQRMRRPLYNELTLVKPDLLGGSYVFLTLDLNAYETLEMDFTMEERCALADVPVPIDKPKLGPMVPKGSPLKRVIDYHIIRTKMFGLNQCWLNRNQPKRPVCSGTGQAGFAAIPLRSVLAALGILGLGFLLSMLVLCIEKCLACTMTLYNIDGGVDIA